MDNGNKDPDEPITRAELERSMRHANLLVDALRDDVLRLGAQVAALTRVLESRGIDCADGVDEVMAEAVEAVQVNHELAGALRVDFGSMHGDKYQAPPLDIPCAELLPLCKGRCCSLEFVLNTQDLDEGVVRFDYAKPYWILQRPDGYCVHNDCETRHCGVYEHRPLPCREFDCRGDKRIWIDYDQRIPAPDSALYADDDEDDSEEALEKDRKEALGAVRTRALYRSVEEATVEAMYGKYEADEEN